MIWITILAMATLVFISRYLLLDPKLPIRLGRRTQAFLSFSAPAVLTAIFAPIVFLRDGSLNLSPFNPYLSCALLATVLVLLTRNTLVTVIISMAVFFFIH
ncbi:AzlD domain-containing protein [Shewanella cyperi]|uniref:AzlD domain-containing protein n=1 Tax=Shewanella cyperi TaxID=2814292 RepID=A0A974XNS1_9GAMM|nr:AzlD domain-containing protein [Shewanella cyperi]QSX31807.1 AzlD domain-containing protein [Shewanella cyperi]